MFEGKQEGPVVEHSEQGREWETSDDSGLKLWQGI